MKKYIAIVAVLVGAVNYTNAQVLLPTYAGDALRFSQTNYGGSARFKAMGNAQIGVGGDISSLGSNPAGLGLYTKSEFVITPEYNATNIDATYLNNNSSTDKSQVNLSQFGVVFHMPTFRMKGQETKTGIVAASVGVGYNRNNDYGLETSFSGTNNKSSVYNMFDGDPAFTLGNKQEGNLIRSGSVSEFNLAGAINISNQVYIGANLGLVSVALNSDSRLYEKGNVDNYQVNYYQNQQAKGSGVNGRVGIIYRPVSELRIGVNLQTPTYYTIDDVTSVSADANAIAPASYQFTYNLTTPLKSSIGASYILGGRALLSADVDFVDYSNIRFSSNSGNSISVINENNTEVKGNYKSAVNYRVGGELKVNELISIRAGYGVNGSAYKDDSDKDFDTQFMSGGIGYRYGNYFFDLAYQRVNTRSTFAPYLLNDYNEPIVDGKNTKQNVFLTFGIRF